VVSQKCKSQNTLLTLKLTPEQLQIPPVKDGIEVIPEIRIAA